MVPLLLYDNFSMLGQTLLSILNSEMSCPRWKLEL